MVHFTCTHLHDFMARNKIDISADEFPGNDLNIADNPLSLVNSTIKYEPTIYTAQPPNLISGFYILAILMLAVFAMGVLLTCLAFVCGLTTPKKPPLPSRFVKEMKPETDSVSDMFGKPIDKPTTDLVDTQKMHQTRLTLSLPENITSTVITPSSHKASNVYYKVAKNLRPSIEQSPSIGKSKAFSKLEENKTKRSSGSKSTGRTETAKGKMRKGSLIGNPNTRRVSEPGILNPIPDQSFLTTPSVKGSLDHLQLALY